jgi:hypothetical protein
LDPRSQECRPDRRLPIGGERHAPLHGKRLSLTARCERAIVPALSLAQRELRRAIPRSGRPSAHPNTTRRREQAEDRAREIERGLAAGSWVDPEAGRTPFGTWAQRWLGTKIHLTVGSQIRLAGIVRNDLAPWHDLPIGKIRRADVQALVAKLSTTKAPATCARHT